MHNKTPEVSSRPSYENLDESRVVDYMVVGCFIMLVFGFSFGFMFFGVARLLALAIGYWKRAYHAFGRFFVKNPTQDFVPLPLTFWQILSMIPMIAFGLIFLGLGFWTLAKFGFLGQHLIYSFLHFGLHIL